MRQLLRRNNHMPLQSSARSILSRGISIGLITLAGLSSSGISQQTLEIRGQAGQRTSAGPARSQAARVPANVRAALDRISPDSLRGHLSFIASDLLEGRNTPSPGLDLAAEYIAAQFRRAGLEPAGDAGEKGERSYFQVAD